MGGGVHWAEWIVPIVGAHHMAYNAAANAAGEPGAKLVTPKSQLDKKRDAQALAETQRQAAADQEAQRQQLAEQRRVDALPENVRRRATSAARSLGESGRRESASQYLAGGI